MGNIHSGICVPKNYQHRMWFDRLIEKIKRCSFFASQGSI